MNKRYELIIFDWDGTLMDSTARIVSSLQQSAISAGLKMPSAEQAKQVIGLGLQEGFAVLFPEADKKDAELVAEHYRHEFVYLNTTAHDLFTGVIEWLEDARRNQLLMAVATGKSRAGLDRELTKHSMHHHFVTTRCADECFSKPHPQMINEILNETGMDPEQAIMIGDTTFDLDMANAAGVDSLGLIQGAHSKDQLLSSAPIAIVDSFNDAASWLNDRIV
jgi:phosphoglycolate phosphatase